tara:strand:- start:33143 stop:33772 length:630 start_codon:yes stop_codon:yes gene_type:complete
MKHYQVCSAALIAAASSCVFAGIATYTSESSQIDSITNSANFNGLINFQSLHEYSEDGLEVSIDRSYFSWNPPGFDGSEMFYAGTGSLDLVEISLGGVDFADIDLQVSSGWLENGPATMYLWVQAYQDGNLVQEFDIDAIGGEYIGFQGGGFDQLFIGSYVSADVRDLHDASQRNAIAIDNIRAGTVPAPGTLAIPAMLLAGLRRKRAC